MKINAIPMVLFRIFFVLLLCILLIPFQGLFIGIHDLLSRISRSDNDAEADVVDALPLVIAEAVAGSAAFGTVGEGAASTVPALVSSHDSSFRAILIQESAIRPDRVLLLRTRNK